MEELPRDLEKWANDPTAPAEADLACVDCGRPTRMVCEPDGNARCAKHTADYFAGGHIRRTVCTSCAEAGMQIPAVAFDDEGSYYCADCVARSGVIRGDDPG